MAKIYLGLGSNVDPATNICKGLHELNARFGEVEISNVYRNKAVGFDGDDFLNMVVGVETDSTPAEVQSEIERIHDCAGRTRGEEKFSSRTLDIDLLLYGDVVSDKPGLRLPRADILKYSFVLRPLAEIAPDLVHPVVGRSMAELWDDFDASNHPLTRVDDILKKS